MSLTFNGQPCEIVQGPDAEGLVCIRYPGDLRWPFPSYTWVSPKALKKTTEKQKQLEALQGIEEALMQGDSTKTVLIACRPVLIDSRGYFMTKETVQMMLALIEAMIDSSVAASWGQWDDVNHAEDVKEDLYPKLMMLLDRMEDDGK